MTIRAILTWTDEQPAPRFSLLVDEGNGECPQGKFKEIGDALTALGFHVMERIEPTRPASSAFKAKAKRVLTAQWGTDLSPAPPEAAGGSGDDEYEAEIARIESLGDLVISGSTRAKLVKALQSLEGHLEGIIEAATFEGKPCTALDRDVVNETQQEWREVENLVLLLEVDAAALAKSGGSGQPAEDV